MHRGSWIAVVLLAFAPAAFASDQIRIAEIGLKGYYQSAVPSRLRVAIIHPDSQPADVQLRVLVHTSFGIERTDTFSTRLSLAPNDQRIVDIPVQLRYSLRATVEVQELDTNGRGITEDTQPLEIPLADESLIAVLCSEPAVCQQIQSQISFSGDQPAQTGKGKFLRFVALNDPPDEFWGYYPARTVILARPLAEMSPARRRALELYIRQGYALIVLEDLSPVSDFLSPYKPRAGSLPANSIGEGRVTWVPSLAGKQLGDLYAGLSLRPAVLGWQSGRAGTDLLSWVRKRLGTRFQFPTLSWLMLWLGAYILIAGFGNFVLLRKLDRREWGWITLPSISIAFACAMYFSTAANRPHELRGDDIAVYWMDEKSPVAFIERGDRVSSNRRQTVALTTNTDEILAGDRNNTGQALTVNMFGGQDVDPLNQWDVTTGPSTTVDLRMLQWSFRDIEFVGPETEPGTVRRLDDTHFRNETGRNFRQGMYVDAANVYFFDAIPSGSQFDLAAATRTKSLRQGTSCRPCVMMGFPSELANFDYNQTNPPNQADPNEMDNQTPDPDAAQMISGILGLAKRPFDLSELIHAWPPNGGQAFDARSGIFFGLADEADPGISFPGKHFLAKGYSLTVVSYEPKP
jgi:hypothetical protein